MSMSKLATVRVKPIVHYVPYKYGSIEEGLPARVIAINHPSHLINPGEVVTTSTVQTYDEATGSFETKNSIYKLLED
jgi:hypothetical protein